MEEITLPNIKEMYSFTQNNRDYVNTIRSYQGSHQTKCKKVSPTKRTNYLDECIRLNCSPGPANEANLQDEWAKKPKDPCKRGQKTTYLDVLTKREKKLNFPSPNKYNIQEQWPKKCDKTKIISQKTNFADTAQYQSDKIPGPGAYNIQGFAKPHKKDNKWNPHKPIHEKENKAADMTTYNPCAVEFNTFERMKKHASHQTLPKKLEKIQKPHKESTLPGPGSYSIINNWNGKEKVKKNEFSLNSLSTAPTPKVYYS